MRENEPKPNEQKYLKHTGDESLPVEITSKEKIGGGMIGDVFSVETKIIEKDIAKNRNFAVKTFRFGGDAQNDLNKFKILKENGLKTFTTYRLGEDEKSILMTNGNKADSFLVSRNNSESRDYLMKNPIEKIANFEQLIIAMIKHAKLAADKKMFLCNDAYLFSVSDTDRPDVKNVDFVIGDLDNVLVYQGEEYVLDLNYNEVKKALQSFVNQYVHKANKQEYLDFLDTKFMDRGLF